LCGSFSVNPIAAEDISLSISTRISIRCLPWRPVAGAFLDLKHGHSATQSLRMRVSIDYLVAHAGVVS
jgi:hypothetical protein